MHISVGNRQEGPALGSHWGTVGPAPALNPDALPPQASGQPGQDPDSTLRPTQCLWHLQKPKFLPRCSPLFSPLEMATAESAEFS